MSTAHRRSILITGASSGIGEATALRLSANGWRVFAAVRKRQDGERLRSRSRNRIETVLLDVADGESIKAARRELWAELAKDGLDGLFNNAGIGVVSPLEFASIDTVRRVYEVNLFGQIRVIQALLPLLRKAKGRIINTGSLGDHITPPFAGVLASSKAAFASVSAALRLELRAQGIHVVIVEPGSINTPAVEKTLGNIEEQIRAFPSEGSSLYAVALRRMATTFAGKETAGSPADVVAEVVEQALNAAKPKTRYLVGKGALLLGTLGKLLPENLLDLVTLKAFGLSTKFDQPVP